MFLDLFNKGDRVLAIETMHFCLEHGCWEKGDTAPVFGRGLFVKARGTKRVYLGMIDSGGRGVHQVGGAVGGGGEELAEGGRGVVHSTSIGRGTRDIMLRLGPFDTPPHHFSAHTTTEPGDQTLPVSFSGQSVIVGSEGLNELPQLNVFLEGIRVYSSSRAVTSATTNSDWYAIASGGEEGGLSSSQGAGGAESSTARHSGGFSPLAAPVAAGAAAARGGRSPRGFRAVDLASSSDGSSHRADQDVDPSPKSPLPLRICTALCFPIDIFFLPFRGYAHLVTTVSTPHGLVPMRRGTAGTNASPVEMNPAAEFLYLLERILTHLQLEAIITRHCTHSVPLNSLHHEHSRTTSAHRVVNIPETSILADPCFEVSPGIRAGVSLIRGDGGASSMRETADVLVVVDRLAAVEAVLSGIPAAVSSNSSSFVRHRMEAFLLGEHAEFLTERPAFVASTSRVWLGRVQRGLDVDH